MDKAIAKVVNFQKYKDKKNKQLESDREWTLKIKQ